VALPALAAERRAAVQRYLLPAGLTAANPQRRQASDLTDWQTDARPLHSLMYTADWWCLRRVSDALIAHQTSLVEHITCPVVNYTALQRRRPLAVIQAGSLTAVVASRPLYHSATTGWLTDSPSVNYHCSLADCRSQGSPAQHCAVHTYVLPCRCRSDACGRSSQSTRSIVTAAVYALLQWPS